MIHYRKMQIQDASGVHAIDLACFAQNWSLSAYEKEIEHPFAHYIVAEQDCVLIGFGGFWKVLDEAHVTNIAVLESYRQKGIGQALMDSMLLEARTKGCRSMTLEVRCDNRPAIAFYKKNRFSSEGKRSDYYGPGVDGMIMWRYELEAID